MTKIMIVDDDAIIRRNIANKIDWKGHGWELVYTARDPMEALDYLKNHEPDIILTDIKMPGITGIEMAAVAKDYYPNIKFIIIFFLIIKSDSDSRQFRQIIRPVGFGIEHSLPVLPVGDFHLLTIANSHFPA